MTLVDGLFAAALVAGCTVGAALDVFFRRLPNLLCLALFAFGCGFAIWNNGWIGLGWHLALSLTVLLVGILLFRLRWIGGGDAKFFAAAAVWFPLQRGPEFVLWVAIAGFALVLVWVGYRRTRGLKLSRQSVSPQDQLPYGVAIGMGTLIGFWMG